MQQGRDQHTAAVVDVDDWLAEEEGATVSQRTLVELNHDYCPKDKELGRWAEQIQIYMRTGNPLDLPQGVTFKHRRHHSEPDPMAGKEQTMKLTPEQVREHLADALKRLYGACRFVAESPISKEQWIARMQSAEDALLLHEQNLGTKEPEGAPETHEQMRMRKCLPMLPELQQVARDNGYALLIHGSLARDIDLVAVPWTEDAKRPDELAELIRLKAAELNNAKVAFLAPHEADQYPIHKPHGRLCWAFHLGGGPYLDLSIMPRLAEPSAPAAAPERCPTCESADRDVRMWEDIIQDICADPWHAAAEQKYTQHSPTCSYWTSNVCNSGCAGHFQARGPSERAPGSEKAKGD